MIKEVVPNVRKEVERDNMLFEVSYLASEVCNSNLLRPMDSIVTSLILKLISLTKLKRKPNQKTSTGLFRVTFSHYMETGSLQRNPLTVYPITDKNNFLYLQILWINWSLRCQLTPQAREGFPYLPRSIFH